MLTANALLVRYWAGAAVYANSWAGGIPLQGRVVLECQLIVLGKLSHMRAIQPLPESIKMVRDTVTRTDPVLQASLVEENKRLIEENRRYQMHISASELESQQRIRELDLYKAQIAALQRAVHKIERDAQVFLTSFVGCFLLVFGAAAAPTCTWKGSLGR